MVEWLKRFRNIRGKKKKNGTMLIICRGFIIKFRNQEEPNMSKRNVKCQNLSLKIDLQLFVCNEWFDVLFEMKINEL
jgi:hypothetical protein